MTLKPATERSSPGLRHALAILGRLSRAGTDPTGFAVLRRECGQLPAGTLSRLLRVLMEEGWVRKTPEGLYLPGAEMLIATARLAGRRTDIEEVVGPVVESLATATGESAAYAEWTGDGFAFRAKREMPDSFHYIPVNKNSADVFRNRFGRICLAWQSEAVIVRILESRTGDAPQALVDQLAELADIRSRDFWIGFDKGTRFLSPVTVDDVFIGVIGVSSYRRDISQDENARFRELVLGAAAAIAQNIHSVTKEGPK